MYGMKVCCLLLMCLGLCYAELTTTPNFNIFKMCKDQQLKDGDYRNPLSCSSYIACSGNVTYIMPCPEGLYYNAGVEKCDYPKNVPECP